MKEIVVKIDDCTGVDIENIEAKATKFHEGIHEYTDIRVRVVIKSGEPRSK